jgi:hypothetical protein
LSRFPRAPHRVVRQTFIVRAQAFRSPLLHAQTGTSKFFQAYSLHKRKDFYQIFVMENIPDLQDICVSNDKKVNIGVAALSHGSHASLGVRTMYMSREAGADAVRTAR